MRMRRVLGLLPRAEGLGDVTRTALLLGEAYARSLGLNVLRARIWIVAATAVLAGVVVGRLVDRGRPFVIRMACACTAGVFLLPQGYLPPISSDEIPSQPIQAENEKLDHNRLSEGSLCDPGKDKTKDNKKDETNPL